MKKTPAADAAALTLATWFGCGYFPAGPGTAGSICALAIAIGLHAWLGWGPLAFLGLALAMLAPGVWAADRAAVVLNVKDPGLVVVDEVLGQWITIAGATVLNWKSWAAALILFRLLDIWKPWPVRRFERLPGGIGIVADDVVAGIFGSLVLYGAGCFNFY
jgi:phosphatidylglycerophosphatase A